MGQDPLWNSYCFDDEVWFYQANYPIKIAISFKLTQYFFLLWLTNLAYHICEEMTPWCTSFLDMYTVYIHTTYHGIFYEY